MIKITIVLVFISFTNILPQWHLSNWPVDNPSDFYFRDSISGLMIGYGYPYKTFDGGKNWFDTQTQTTFNNAKLYFINNNIGFAFRYSIRKTKDFGDTWEDVTPKGSHEFLDMYFINDSTGYIVGLNGQIFMTNDQGLNWQEVIYPKFDTNDNFYTIYFSGRNNGWIIGSDIRLITTDGGYSWNKEYATNLTNLLNYDIKGVCFLDSLDGYALSSYRKGQILKTINGGKEWSEVTMPYQLGEGELKSICFTDTNIGFVGGGVATNDHLYGIIYKTIDGGNTWVVIYKSDVSSEISKIIFYDEKYGWAFGNLGFLYTESGGVTQVDNDIKYNYVLINNYPNPFNPNTTIEYSIDKASNVKIVIYDLLGREVETIVNEYKNTGNYKVVFNGSNLPSGVYYYQLNCKNQLKTKSMILLK